MLFSVYTACPRRKNPNISILKSLTADVSQARSFHLFNTVRVLLLLLVLVAVVDKVIPVCDIYGHRNYEKHKSYGYVNLSASNHNSTTIAEIFAGAVCLKCTGTAVAVTAFSKDFVENQITRNYHLFMQKQAKCRTLLVLTRW